MYCIVMILLEPLPTHSEVNACKFSLFLARSKPYIDFMDKFLSDVVRFRKVFQHVDWMFTRGVLGLFRFRVSVSVVYMKT